MRALLWIICPIIVFGGNSDNHPLTITVDPINKLAFTEPSVVINVDQFSKTLITGVHQSTYGIISNDGHQKKITVSLNQDYPNQIALKLSTGSSGGFIANGYVTLQSKATSTLITSISPNINLSNLSIGYFIEAPRLTPSNLTPYVATVTFTLQDD